MIHRDSRRAEQAAGGSAGRTAVAMPTQGVSRLLVAVRVARVMTIAVSIGRLPFAGPFMRGAEAVFGAFTLQVGIEIVPNGFPGGAHFEDATFLAIADQRASV